MSAESEMCENPSARRDVVEFPVTPHRYGAGQQRQVSRIPFSGVPSERLSADPDAYANTLYGREEDIAVTGQLLARTRLLTLVGEPGVGKSRLGAAVLDKCRDMALHLDVGVATGRGLIRSVADLVGAATAPGDSVLDAVATALPARGEAWLLLDNCEYDLGGCADLLATLLPRCPRLKALATSREHLGLPGETVYTVTGLRTGPTDGHTPQAAERLFLDRVRTVRHDPAFAANRTDDVARVCRTLDGNPLAIELAAELARVSSPAEILTLLDDRLTALTGGRPTADARHRSLRAAIDWSYRRLSRAERSAFRQLAVLPGSFDADTAEAVVDVRSPDRTVPPTLFLLASLEAKSLLVARPGSGSDRRLAMTGSIRAFALDRLAESEEARGAEARLVAVMAKLALPYAEAGLLPGRSLVGLVEESANLSAAAALLEGSEDDRRVTLAVARLVGCEVAEAAAPRDRAGLVETARVTGPEAAGRGTGMAAVAVLAARRGDTLMALSLAEEAVELARRTCHHTLPHRLRVLASAHARAGDLDAAVRAAADGAASAGRLRDREAELWCRTDALGYQVGRGRLTEAAEASRPLADAAQDLAPTPALAALRHTLGALRFRRGDATAAAALFRSGLLTDHTGPALTAWGLEGMALTAAASGGAARSLRLLHAAHTLRERAGDPPMPWWQGWLRETYIASVRALPTNRVQAEARAGAALPARQAVAWALDEDGIAATGQPPSLTSRQRQVVDLIAEGLTNQQIATRLHISVRTVETHIWHVRQQHGLRSRAHLAAWSVRQRARPDDVTVREPHPPTASGGGSRDSASAEARPSTADGTAAP
ncbi:ATP-binding protein [Streptomyces sp. NPDC127038]|uniref:ATP-binding protein n=1 Tax=Streptomyces sp. NPDC127038 TaxID=3347114 RepID=UPI0036675282